MKKVFEAHPKATEIFVVNGMPFLEEVNAEKHCDDLKVSREEIKKVARGAEPEEDGSGDGGEGGEGGLVEGLVGTILNSVKKSDTGGEAIAEVATDYSKLTKAVIQAKLTERKIEFDSKAKKDDLIELLKKADLDAGSDT